MKYKVKQIKFGMAVQINRYSTYHYSDELPKQKGVEAIYDSDKGVFFIKDEKGLKMVPVQGNCIYAALGEAIPDEKAEAPPQPKKRRGRPPRLVSNV